MASFPMDIVTDVLHRLPATTLVRCLLLSKPCFSLINSPDFIASHLKRTLETEDHIMILLLTILRLLSLIENPLLTGGFTQFFGSVNGIIGLTNPPTDFALFNPSTRKIHPLPVAPIDFPERSLTRRQYVFYGLGHDSVTDDYKVVRMIQSKDRGGDDESVGYPFEVKVFSLKSNKWKRVQLLSEDVEILFDSFFFRLLYRRGNGVLVSNSLHWILIHNEGDFGMNTIIRYDLATDELGLVSFSHDVYCKGMDIGVLGGCLCMMCYNEVRHADVWIMREYGGEWSKFLSVPQPESVVSFEFVRPLVYSKDRRKILFEINNGKLFWFDLGSKSFETLVIKGCEDLQCNAEIVVSSLVLGCKGDLGRAREKKMMQKGNKRWGAHLYNVLSYLFLFLDSDI
ncbi:unnamed protein product [Eruca vesicaria subsp. sativa]|uniref:F-box associated beta-propeller type 3 domain-containing protein n=1 Tax=Eruca vesicaria subsp. sativa TaxID=29727 RepID=A0ABC8L2M1_ERUVS|nr:unnamed protein product [Eruca vesicaria subsp. sativa]